MDNITVITPSGILYPICSLTKQDMQKPHFTFIFRINVLTNQSYTINSHLDVHFLLIIYQHSQEGC